MDNFNKKSTGTTAELKACDYLQSYGMRLIEKNYYCPFGEIDLIMQDGEDIVFVEVRSRNKDFANVLESIDQYKQAKLIKTATFYLQKKRCYDTVNCRFDVVGINNMQLEWIKNAFYTDNF